MAQSTCKILVVDDDPDVLSVAKALLAQEGYTVLEAVNGSDALRLLHAHPDIALLFTDIVMPGPIDGFDLAERAKRLRPDLPVLYTSGYLKNEGVWAATLLAKPWRPAHLAEAVKNLLG